MTAKSTESIKTITKISLMTALMCVSAMIYIPIAVPITMQSLVLYFSLFYLGGTEGIFAVLVTCVLPFIIPDAVKILIAYALSRRIKKYI